VGENLGGTAASVGDAEIGKGIGSVAKSFAATIGNSGEAVAEKIAGTDGIRKHGTVLSRG
jgi:hypothetical protein